MTLTHTDLAEVDLGRLETAVGDWKATAGHLKTLASDAKNGMQAKSDSARWAGVNATVTREFIRKTAKEVGDLHREAQDIYQLLDDAHRELASLQRSLRSLINQAEGKGLKITDHGDGTVTLTEQLMPGEPSKLESGKELKDLANQIASKLQRADEIDKSVHLALTRIHGNDEHNAGHADYNSVNDAEAARAVELAKKGSHMTNAELKELDRLLGYHSKDKDGEFATDFYKGLGGPKKTLEFYEAMSIDGTDPNASKTRLDEVRDLQKAMGMNLAIATDPGDAKHPKYHLPASWGTDFRRLGTQRIAWTKGQTKEPYGYQVLGGLLRYGNYDPSFIVPIAEHVTQLHEKDPTFFMDNKPEGSPDSFGFNPSGKMGSGNDPLNSVLESLGHSPEAAEDFFANAPTAYNADGTVNHGGHVGFKSYLDLFTDEHFHWNADTNDPGPDLLADQDKYEKAMGYGPESLGHALEAATTGRAYDDDSTLVKHTTTRAHLVEEIVEKFGKHPQLIRHNENGDMGDEDNSGPLYAMRGSLGDITADYMGDFQRAMYDEDPGSKEFPSFGAPATFDGGNVIRFLGEVGQDPHAYGTITAAQQAYTSDVVDRVIGGNLHASDLSTQVGDAVAPGSAIAGAMSEARAHAIYDYHAASDKDFNEGAADKQKWVNRVLEMGTGKVEEVPFVGTGIGWASEDIQDSVMKSIEHDTSDDASDDASRDYSNGREHAIASSRDAVDRAARNHPGLDAARVEAIKRHIKTVAGQGHSDGATWAAAGHQ